MATAVTYRSHSTASGSAAGGPYTTFDIAAPVGVQEGDFLLLGITYNNQPFTDPVGWTKIATTNTTGTNLRIAWLTRIAPAGLGTTTVDSSNQNSYAAILVAFQNARASLTWSNSGASVVELATTQSTIQTLGNTTFEPTLYPNDVCVSANALDVVLFGWVDGAADIDSFDTLTEIATVISGAGSSDVGLSVAYKTQTTLDKPVGVSSTITSDVERGANRFILYPALQDADYENTVKGYNPQYYWPCDGTYVEEINGGNNNAQASTTANSSGTAADPIIPNTTQHSIDFDNATANDMQISSDAGINTGTGYDGSFRAVSGWFITDDIVSNDMPIWKQGGGSNGLSVSVDAGVLRAVAIESSAVAGYCSYTISASTLYHFLWVMDSSDTVTGLKLYINGSLVDTQSHTISGGDLAAGSGGVTIGDSNGTWRTWDGGNQASAYFKGKIQSVAYWNTDSEDWAAVAAGIYNAGVSSGASSLLLQRRMREYGLAL